MITRRDVFQGIADPARREILQIVAEESMTAGAIAEQFDTSRQTISKHIKILCECELLTQKQKGRELYYRLNPKKLKEVTDFVDPYRKLWDDRYIKLQEALKPFIE